MKRRDLILLGGAAVAWPLPGAAQQAGKSYLIGVLETIPAAENSANYAPLHRSLLELDYIEGTNISFKYLSADGHAERYPDLAAELVRQKVDLILTRGTPAHYRRAGRRVRLPDPADAGFLAAYQAAHAEAEALVAERAVGTPKAAAGSLAALIAAYRASEDWQGFAVLTRDEYGRAFDRLESRYGRLSVATMPRAMNLLALRRWIRRESRCSARTGNLSSSPHRA
jgi:hypothetical protein